MDILYSDEEPRSCAEIRHDILTNPAFWISQVGNLVMVGLRCITSWAIAIVVSHYFLMVWAVSLADGDVSRRVSQWTLREVYGWDLFTTSAVTGFIIAVSYLMANSSRGRLGLRNIYGEFMQREIRGWSSPFSPVVGVMPRRGDKVSSGA